MQYLLCNANRKSHVVCPIMTLPMTSRNL